MHCCADQDHLTLKHSGNTTSNAFQIPFIHSFIFLSRHCVRCTSLDADPPWILTSLLQLHHPISDFASRSAQSVRLPVLAHQGHMRTHCLFRSNACPFATRSRQDCPQDLSPPCSIDLDSIYRSHTTFLFRLSHLSIIYGDHQCTNTHTARAKAFHHSYMMRSSAQTLLTYSAQPWPPDFYSSHAGAYSPSLAALQRPYHVTACSECSRWLLYVSSKPPGCSPARTHNAVARVRLRDSHPRPTAPTTVDMT